jgi:hypothetical protein
MIVLGKGFVGRALCSTIEGCVGTSRFPTKNVLHFDLNERKTWSVLDNFQSVVWTFPCASDNSLNPSPAIEFYSEKLKSKNVVIFGTTSCYQAVNSSLLQFVTEETTLCHDTRTQTEESLRKMGANIFCLSGLWGETKLPLHWIQKGLIKSSFGCVNLIHEADIAHIIKLYFESPAQRGMRVNVSSGVPYYWKYLLQHYAITKELSESVLENLNCSSTPRPSKLVSNQKLISLFPELKQHTFRSPFETRKI